MGAQVEPKTASERLQALQAQLFEQQVAFNQAQAVGRSPYLQSVHVDDADHLIGRIVPVTIEHGQQNSLTGKLMNQNATPLKQRDAARRAIGAQ